MAVTLQCPRCSHEQKIDDDKLDKEVPCKICHHLIKPAGKKEKPTSKLAGDEEKKKASPQGVQAGPPKVSAKGASAKIDDDDDDDTPKSKKKKRRDDDAEERRPVPRGRQAEEGSSAMLFVGLAIGGVLLVMVMCGGLALGGYFMFGATPDVKIEPIAQNNEPNPPPVNPNANPNPNPGPFPNPNPNPNPNPFPNPKPNPNPNPFPNPNFPNPALQNFDPNNPNEMDRVMPVLTGPEKDRGRAYAWLERANENHPRRLEVAKVLEGHVNDYLTNPPTFGNDSMFNSYFKWATKENVPGIANVVEKIRFTAWDNKYRDEAIRVLGKLKDPRGAEALTKRLGDFFSARQSADALIEMGSAAEPAVLKYFNHPDGNARNEARRVIQNYKTNPDAIITQCVTDLDSTDDNRRRGALQWFTTAAVDAKRKSDVAKALNKSIGSQGPFFDRDLAKVLENWATSDNVPALIQRLNTSKTGNNEVIAILGKIRDTASIDAIAMSMGNFFNQQAAKDALKAIGAPAEAAVAKAMLAQTDPNARRTYVQYLGENGTRAGSIPALTALAQRNPQDRFLQMNIQQAVVAINGRGK